MGDLALSILDQSPVPSGSTPADAVANTLDLARHADRLGYTRYWVAEHHNSAALAGAAPEILIGRIASVTGRIRVGSGGVMLPHYSPLKVAEQFRMLHTLFPGRIDLGIGRAPGTDPVTARALGQMMERVERFPDEVVDLAGFLYGRLHPEHPLASVRAMPAGEGAAAGDGPEIWMLGSSAFGGALAAQLGLGFSFAHFINPDPGPAVVDAYRRDFRPLVGDEPRVSVGVSVLCADTDAEAARLASSLPAWRELTRRGRGSRIPSVDEAEALLHAAGKEPWVAGGGGRLILGDPERCRADLLEVAGRYDADEAVVLTICHDHGARLRSHELLAEAFELPASPASPEPNPGGSPR